jgi:hypothetical protein
MSFLVRANLRGHASTDLSACHHKLIAIARPLNNFYSANNFMRVRVKEHTESCISTLQSSLYFFVLSFLNYYGNSRRRARIEL